MAKEIPLTQGKVAIVDDEDYDRINQYKWCCHKRNNGGDMAVRNSSSKLGKRKTIRMHREIMNAPFDKVIDHINHDTLDNRHINLRTCNQCENSHNTLKPKDNTSGYKGVSRDKTGKKWRVRISMYNINYNIGIYDDPAKAAKAYDEFAKEHFGEFALLNFPG